jgi:hypothetical protein
MKKTILAATLAAAFALPTHAAEVHFEGPDGKKMEFNFDFDFDLDLDVPGILAQADEAKAAAAAARAKAREDAARAREEGARAREEGARAREEAARVRAEAHAAEMSAWSAQFSADLSNSMMYMFTDRAGRGRVVKGAPYSADIVTETNQTLPDGNVISHKNMSKAWRDSEGRTRQEIYRGDKLRSVYISDPVANMAYTLLPERKVAVQVPRMDLSKHMVAPRAHVETSTKSRTVTTETSSDGKRVIVRTVDADGTPGVREEVRVQVVRVGDDASVHIAPIAPTPPDATHSSDAADTSDAADRAACTHGHDPRGPHHALREHGAPGQGRDEDAPCQGLRRREGRGQGDHVDDSRRADRQPEADPRHVGVVVFAGSPGDGLLAPQRSAHR